MTWSRHATRSRPVPPCGSRHNTDTQDRDGGFLLLETMISISLITVIMGALGMLYVTTLSVASHQRARATAVQVATTAMDALRSHDASSLVTGRDSVSVATEMASAQARSAPVSGYLSGMTSAVDSQATTGSGATAFVPTVGTTVTVGSTTFTVTRYLGQCYDVADASGTDSCTSSSSTSSVPYLRAVIAVSWPGSGCTLSSCTYVTSGLFSATTDPTFLMNQPLPAAPSITDPGNQSNAVNDTVSLQLQVQGSSGVPPFSWTATGLPAGLGISPTGLISGTPTAQNSSPATITVTVTDAFLRTDTDSFTWRIYPALTATTPGARANTTVDSVNFDLSPYVSGGTGSPYTWSLASGSLPTGLTINGSAQTITGTPTRAGTFTFALTVTDNSGTRTATTNSITWTITYPPLALTPNPPPNQVTTVNRSDSLQLTASGGSGSVTWSATGLPTGLTINSSGRISGTPTVTRSAGTVTATATDATAGTSKTVTFTWAVVAAPTIGTPAAQFDTIGGGVSVPLTASCPNSPCSYVLSNGPGGVTADATPQMTGTVTGSAQTYSNVKVTVTDADGATATTAAFTWTVYRAPTISVPDATVGENATPSIPVTYTCPYTSCTITTTSGGVPGIGLSTSVVKAAKNTTTSVTVSSTSGTVYLNGLVGTTAVTSGNSANYAPTLKIVDADSVSASDSASWVAYQTPTIATPNGVTVARGANANKAVAVTCYSSSGCSVSVSGLPSGVGLSTTANRTTANSTTSLTLSASGTVYLTGKVSSTATQGSMTVTISVTDTVSGSVTVSSAGTWTVS